MPDAAGGVFRCVSVLMWLILVSRLTVSVLNPEGCQMVKVRKHSDATGPNEKYLVPVVRSTFRILAEISKAGSLGLNEITRRAEVSKSTVFRILTTLTHMGYVVRDANRNYYVSRTLADLVSAPADLDALRRAALPSMLKLRDQFGETVNLGQLQLDKMIYVEVVPSENALRLHERPGAIAPVHASALGKAVLAFLSQQTMEALLRDRDLEMLTRHTITGADKLIEELQRVRERGYAFDRGETSLLVTCVGAPILGTNDTPLGAMSISGPTSRFNPTDNSPVIDALLRAVADVSKELRRGPRKNRRNPPSETGPPSSRSSRP